MKKTFIIISLSDRVNELNKLIESIIRYERFNDYDINLIYQDYLGNKDQIKYITRYRKIFIYDHKLGCHGARVQLLNDIDVNNYDVFINLDDDMVLTEYTDYDKAIEKALEPATGFVLTNWARSEKILLNKALKMSDTFIKQVMVYQGGGMVYSTKIAKLMKDLPIQHAEFDDLWCITSYINGYENYRFLGSLAIHRICTKGGMNTYMRETKRPLLSSKYINYRKAKNGRDTLIPCDADINDYAKELHKKNNKEIK